MPLAHAQLVLFSDLGNASASRLFDIRRMTPESLRSVFRYILRDHLDPLDDEDCVSALEVIAEACSARWRAILEPESE